MNGADDSLLKNARFRRLWIGQGLSFVGDFVSTVALVLLVVDVSGSASAVGGVLVARLLPTLASPLVGVLADRLDRRAVLVAADLVRAVLVLGLIFARDLPIIFALVFLLGVAQTVFNPTVRAAFPSVVGGGDLTRANAIISGTFSFSVMAGPALGGVLVATVGVELAFLLDALTFLASAALLSTIRLPAPERDGGEEGFFEELRAGFGYLASARVPPIVAGAFLATLTANAAIPAEAFLAKDTFGAGDVGYGLLASLWGGGMILGSALTVVLGGRINLISLYFTSIFVTAVAFVGVGFSPTFVLALGAIAVAGVANGVAELITILCGVSVFRSMFDDDDCIRHKTGPYEIRSQLGAGGMGEVYLAVDTELDRTVAIKILPETLNSDKQRLQRFIQEAKAASALNHPHILTIYEIGTAGTTRFIATEFIDGDALRRRMSAGTKLVEILEISIQTSSALAAAHAAGIVHRDIKPENIMVRPDGYIKLLNFGLAKLTEPQNSITDTEAPTKVRVNTSAGRDGHHELHVTGAGKGNTRRCALGSGVWEQSSTNWSPDTCLSWARLQTRLFL